jgi:hypothetical protein
VTVFLRPEVEGDGLMNRKELLEAASQHLSTAIILLTVAGEDRLALDLEEIAGRLDFPSLPPDAKPMPGIHQ